MVRTGREASTQFGVWLRYLCISNLTGYFSGFQLLTQISFVCFFIIFIVQSELTVASAALVYL